MLRATPVDKNGAEAALVHCLRRVCQRELLEQISHCTSTRTPTKMKVYFPGKESCFDLHESDLNLPFLHHHKTFFWAGAQKEKIPFGQLSGGAEMGCARARAQKERVIVHLVPRAFCVFAARFKR